MMCYRNSRLYLFPQRTSLFLQAGSELDEPKVPVLGSVSLWQAAAQILKLF